MCWQRQSTGICFVTVLAVAGCAADGPSTRDVTIADPPQPLPAYSKPQSDETIANNYSMTSYAAMNQIITTAEAYDLFDRICLDTVPTFEGAPDVMRRLGLTIRSSTGTYFHTHKNLSVQLTGDGSFRCSLVFKPRKEDVADQRADLNTFIESRGGKEMKITGMSGDTDNTAITWLINRMADYVLKRPEGPLFLNATFGNGSDQQEGVSRLNLLSPNRDALSSTPTTPDT